MINSGSYIMWFTRYRSPEMHVRDSIEECYDLEWILEEADTAVFDQYGVLSMVECVGQGVIDRDEWNRGLEAFKARRRAEIERHDLANPRPHAVGCIEIQSADSDVRFGGWVYLARFFSLEDLNSELVRLRTILPEHRVRSRVFEKAAS